MKCLIESIECWAAMIPGRALWEMGSAILLFDEMPERDVPSWNAIIAG